MNKDGALSEYSHGSNNGIPVLEGKTMDSNDEKCSKGVCKLESEVNCGHCVRQGPREGASEGHFGVLVEKQQEAEVMSPCPFTSHREFVTRL